MRARWLISLLMFALAFPALAQDRRGGSLDRVLPHVRQTVPGTFYDAEGPFFGSDGQATYRLKWMTPDGRIIWLNVDAQNGRVLGGAPSQAPRGRYRDDGDRDVGSRPRNNWQDNGGGWGDRGSRSDWGDRSNSRGSWGDWGDRNNRNNQHGGDWGDRSNRGGNQGGDWGDRDRGGRSGGQGSWGDRDNRGNNQGGGWGDRGGRNDKQGGQGNRGNWGGRDGRGNDDRGGARHRPGG
jgi:hypothetical protein